MPASSFRAFSVLPAAVLAAGCLSSPGGTGGRDTFVVPRAVTLSVRGNVADLGGDFDGDTLLVGPDVTLVPDAGSGSGGSLAVGYVQEGLDFELAYERDRFDDVELEAIAFSFAYHFRANERLQPIVEFAFLVPWATLEDSSTDGVRVGDGELTAGFGLRLGVGEVWYLTDTVALDARVAYSYVEFSEAEGVLGIEGDIDDAVYGHLLTATLGLTLHLPLRSRWDR